MGLESSTYIDGLVATNPLGTDNRNQGDDHIRLIKSTIKSSFPDVNNAVMTIHNGSSAPSAKQTGTIWRDTGNSLWKFWNGSAWITLPFAFNTSNSVDVNAGTIDGVTIGGSSAPTVTNLGSVATCDINGGTIDGVTIGGAVAPTVTNIDINGGSVDGVTLGTNSAVTDARIDNIKIDGNEVSVTNSGGDLTLTPNGSGDLILDGVKWPQADGSNTNYLTTNGSGQAAWTTNTVVTSENNAATSATNAATSATAAQTAKTAAETAKTAAETAKTGAETAQTAAEVALDTFDDRMLGAKASAPSVDNDGNSLIDGAMFFNTTSDYMMVYNLANTTWYQLTNTTSDQNNINTVAGIQANVTTVAGISSNVTSVAGISSDVTAVAGKATEVGRLGTTACVSDMSDLGTTANVTAMSTLGTSANVTAMSNCSGSIANINTTATNIADVNNFANVYRIASSDPSTSLNTGDMVFNTTSNKTRVYNGSAWQDVSPTSTTNAFSTVAVSGQSNVVADSTTDTLNIATGDASTLTVSTNAGTDTVTFTGIDNSVPMAIALG